MGLNIKKFESKTGLAYDKKSRLISGYFNCIPCSAKFIDAYNNTIIIKFFVSGNSSIKSDYNDELNAIKNSNKPTIKKLSYQDNEITATILASGVNHIEKIYTAMMDIINFCSANSLTACCSKCGEHVFAEHYDINDTGTYLCSSCCTSVQSELSQNEFIRKEVVANVPMGIIGAVLGALILFILTYIFYKLGYIVYITGAIGVIVSMHLYNKFSGKLTTSSAIGCIIFCLTVSILSGLFCYAKDLTELYKEVVNEYNSCVAEYEWMKTATDEEYYSYYDEPREDNLLEYEDYINEYKAYLDEYKNEGSIIYCMFHTKEIMSSYDNSSEMISGLIEFIVISFVSVLLGGIFTFKQIVNKAAGKYEIRMLNK